MERERYAEYAKETMREIDRCSSKSISFIIYDDKYDLAIQNELNNRRDLSYTISSDGIFSNLYEVDLTKRKDKV